MERRGAAERKSGVSENSELTDDEIRKLVTAGYEEGWRRSKLKLKDDEDAHETALLSGLLGRISGPNEWSSIPHEIAQAIMMETLPFKFSGSHAEGRLALIEYAVWREVPSQADAALVQRSVTAMVENMKNSGDTDFLLSVKKMPLPWIKLLPEGVLNSQ
ncbi:hypothetical protein GH722_20145 [Alphaproteobacteria bacterium HT1-32]|nr:hypothetical protein [Alphaproteobacteria bacterium HT1-32]